MEAYIKQKRATPGMVQSTTAGTDFQPHRSMQGYDGPLQFLTSPNNPDQILPLSTPTTPGTEEGEKLKDKRTD